MSLDDKALEYLGAGNVLTPAVGEQLWRCLAVHSLIARLRKRGHTITCKMKRRGTRSWGEYRLAPVVQAVDDGPPRPFDAALRLGPFARRGLVVTLDAT